MVRYWYGMIWYSCCILFTPANFSEREIVDKSLPQPPIMEKEATDIEKRHISCAKANAGTKTHLAKVRTVHRTINTLQNMAIRGDLEHAIRQQVHSV